MGLAGKLIFAGWLGLSTIVGGVVGKSIEKSLYEQEKRYAMGDFSENKKLVLEQFERAYQDRLLLRNIIFCGTGGFFGLLGGIALAGAVAGDEILGEGYEAVDEYASRTSGENYPFNTFH